ncbi:MAG: multicopper oxidase family protein [Synechococcus sp.]
MHELEVQILDNGPATKQWVYVGFQPDGTPLPWPVIRQRGGMEEIDGQRQSVVRFENCLGKDREGHDICTSVHLHGMASLPEYDGYAEDLMRPGYFKNYIYPNDRAATIWYHDHAIEKTSRNVAMGLAGFYLIEDEVERQSGLPMGEYDIPLLLQEVTLGPEKTPDGRDNPDYGQIIFNNRNNRSHYGDIQLVNGVPWPRFTVERRKYRFRILNATASRLYQLFLSQSLERWTGDVMHVVASDCGLLSQAVPIPSGRFPSGPKNVLRMGNAERYEIVIDFSNYEDGDTVYLRNDPAPLSRDPSNRSEALIRFDVAGPVVDDGLPWPPRLPYIPPIQTEVDDISQVTTRNWRFGLTGSKWTINGKLWDKDRIDAEIPAGDFEIWELQNAGGGWIHPVHIHLADFQILDRNGLPPLPYETGWKDVFLVGEFETVRVMARLGVPRGKLSEEDPGDEIQGIYMMHCHNLVHEDHDMMTQFKVVGEGEEPSPPCSCPAQQGGGCRLSQA